MLPRPRRLSASANAPASRGAVQPRISQIAPSARSVDAGKRRGPALSVTGASVARLLTSLRGTVEIVQAQEDVLTELMAARGIVPPERPALSVLPGGKAEGP